MSRPIVRTMALSPHSKQQLQKQLQSSTKPNPQPRLTERQQLALLLKQTTIEDELHSDTSASESSSDEEEKVEKDQIMEEANSEQESDDDESSTAESTPPSPIPPPRARMSMLSRRISSPIQPTRRKKNIQPLPVYQPHDYHTWENDRKKCWNQLHKSPDTYYYKYPPPGWNEPRRGVWSEVEKQLLLLACVNHPPEEKNWGLFSMNIPGRTGQQCEKFFLELQAAGEIDEDGKPIKIPTSYPSMASLLPIITPQTTPMRTPTTTTSRPKVKADGIEKRGKAVPVTTPSTSTSTSTSTLEPKPLFTSKKRDMTVEKQKSNDKQVNNKSTPINDKTSDVSTNIKSTHDQSHNDKSTSDALSDKVSDVCNKRTSLMPPTKIQRLEKPKPRVMIDINEDDKENVSISSLIVKSISVPTLSITPPPNAKMMTFGEMGLVTTPTTSPIASPTATAIPSPRAQFAFHTVSDIQHAPAVSRVLTMSAEGGDVRDVVDLTRDATKTATTTTTATVTATKVKATSPKASVTTTAATTTTPTIRTVTPIVLAATASQPQPFLVPATRIPTKVQAQTQAQPQPQVQSQVQIQSQVQSQIQSQAQVRPLLPPLARAKSKPAIAGNKTSKTNTVSVTSTPTTTSTSTTTSTTTESPPYVNEYIPYQATSVGSRESVIWEWTLPSLEKGLVVANKHLPALMKLEVQYRLKLKRLEDTYEEQIAAIRQLYARTQHQHTNFQYACLELFQRFKGQDAYAQQTPDVGRAARTQKALYTLEDALHIVETDIHESLQQLRRWYTIDRSILLTSP